MPSTVTWTKLSDTDELFHAVGRKLGWYGLDDEVWDKDGNTPPRLFEVRKFATDVDQRRHRPGYRDDVDRDGRAKEMARGLERYADEEIQGATLASLRSRAEANEPHAMLLLSDALIWGFLGTAINHEEGNSWQKRASERGHLPAIANIANNIILSIAEECELLLPIPKMLEAGLHCANILAAAGYESVGTAVAQVAVGHGLEIDRRKYPALLHQAARGLVERRPTESHQRRCHGPGCTVRTSSKYVLRRCVACGLTTYCSSQCKAKHWPLHKRECKLARKQQDDDAATVAPPPPRRKTGKKKKKKKDPGEFDVAVGASTLRCRGTTAFSAREAAEQMGGGGLNVPEDMVLAEDAFDSVVEDYLDTSFAVDVVCLLRMDGPVPSWDDFVSGRYKGPVFHPVCLVREHRPREFDAYDLITFRTHLVRAEDLCLLEMDDPLRRSPDLRFQAGDHVEILLDRWRPGTIVGCFSGDKGYVYEGLVSTDATFHLVQVPGDTDTVVRKRS